MRLKKLEKGLRRPKAGGMAADEGAFIPTR
jgi:hypothetical protein